MSEEASRGEERGGFFLFSEERRRAVKLGMRNSLLKKDWASFERGSDELGWLILIGPCVFLSPKETSHHISFFHRVVASEECGLSIAES